MKGIVQTKEFGVRWMEFDKNDRPVIKDKFFDTQKQMDGFIKRLEKKSNFYKIIAWRAA